MHEQASASCCSHPSAPSPSPPEVTLTSSEHCSVDAVFEDASRIEHHDASDIEEKVICVHKHLECGYALGFFDSVDEMQSHHSMFPNCQSPTECLFFLPLHLYSITR